ncbi:adk-1 [Symbiodinium sp. CCMP2592]|nr:adk-1 [Symbiodinium sp. CCMP2592]
MTSDGIAACHKPNHRAQLSRTWTGSDTHEAPSLFRRYDADGTGEVDKDKLVKVLELLDVCTTIAQKAVDSCEKTAGKVRYQDFFDWVMHPAAPPASVRTIVVLSGPPASGKSTVSAKLAEHLGIPKLTIRDLLRAAIALGSALGRQVEGIIKRGGVVPDPLLMQLIQGRVRCRDCNLGYVLDGFPETYSQAKLLDALFADSGDAVMAAIILDVDADKLHARRAGCWYHRASGRSYHTAWMPPRSLVPGEDPCEANMLDDVTGEPLTAEGSGLDEQELAQRGQEVAEMSLHYGNRVRRVLANGAPDEVWKALQGVLSHFKPQLS